MKDLINRQDAIDAIFGRSHEIIKMRISNLPSAESEQRWIPCSERFPEKYVEVLVSVNYKYKGEPKERYTDIASLTEKGWAFVWDVYHRLNEFNEVVAWMHLPDAYEAE